MTNHGERVIVVYYDETSDPRNPGWVARCSHRDERGNRDISAEDVDVQLDATTCGEARAEAAKHFGCDVEEVAAYDGEWE
jgi:hypothetical protein